MGIFTERQAAAGLAALTAVAGRRGRHCRVLDVSPHPATSEFEDQIDLAEHGTRIATTKTGDVNLNTARGGDVLVTTHHVTCSMPRTCPSWPGLSVSSAGRRGRWNGGNRSFGFGMALDLAKTSSG